jgi:NIMA (never in mitosis gene a)-related kinase
MQVISISYKIDDGDLQKYIKTHIKSYKMISEEEIWKAAEHILKGLNHLHKKGIMHRDIKCANIFKSKAVYKLGDLNVSKVNGDKMAHTQTGTPYYASPEVWRD